jgi:sodium/proline symporter
LYATAELFHPVLAGVMTAAVLSAIMSTADSQLLVASSAVTNDLRLGRARTLVVSRLTVLLLSTGATIAALCWDETIFNQVLFAWAAMGSAFGPLLLVTVLSRPVRPGFGITAMASGFTLSVGAFYLGKPLELAQWSGASERVLPFLVALAIALWGRERRWPAGS